MKSSTLVLLTAALLTLGGSAAAASFDCALQTLSTVERTICDTPALSTLDEQLGAAYKQRRPKDKAVSADQRRWVVDVRNKCTTAGCLEAAYTRRIAELKDPAAPATATATKACAVTEAALSGVWENTGKGGQEFDSLAFVVDAGAGATHSFVSWLHAAPFATGTWTFQDCKVHVTGSGNHDDFDFIVLGLAGGVLRLKDVVDDDTLELRKSKEQFSH